MSKIPAPAPETIVNVPGVGILMFSHIPARVMEVYAGAPISEPGTMITFVNGFWDMSPGLRSVILQDGEGRLDWRHVGEVFNMGTEPAKATAKAIADRLGMEVTPAL